MKELFNSLISNTVKPFLKIHDFKKKGLNFYHIRNDLIFLINFQNSRGNNFEENSFYINCAIHSTKIDETIGKEINTEPKEYQCYFNKRIEQIVQSNKDVFIINQQTNVESLGVELLELLNELISFFNTIQTDDDLVDLMIEKNGLYHYEELLEYLSINGMDEKIKSYIIHLHKKLGTDERWKSFEKKIDNILISHKKSFKVANLI